MRDFIEADDFIQSLLVGGPSASSGGVLCNIASNANGQTETSDQFIIQDMTTGTRSIDFDATGPFYEAVVFARIGLGHTFRVDSFDLI